MRAGVEYFLQPGEPAQRQYEALRAYFVEHATAAEVAEAFGYSVATVHQMAHQLRAGRAELFRSSRPGFSLRPHGIQLSHRRAHPSN